MNQILWTPTQSQVDASQMEAFRKQVNARFNLNLNDYHDLHQWSVSNITDFWKAIWGFMAIKFSSDYKQVVDDDTKMPGAKWFDGVTFNFAENLLRVRSDKPAIHFKGEGQPAHTLSYNELFHAVETLASALRKMGLKKGDRVAGFMPNMPETIIAMLATTAIGAIWSSSSPDFGIKGVLDRFTQIEPKFLFAANGYFYNGKPFDSINKLNSILDQLPTVEKVVITPYTEFDPDISSVKNGVMWDDFVDTSQNTLEFEQVSFDHPLYIMYSSGTTGLPKSIVHGAGGTLLQHLKELRLHGNIGMDDTVFYFTTCGWMMWNWLVSNLAIGATIVLYDGSPFHPNSNAMWDMVDELEITHFGTSAKFIDACRQEGLAPRDTHSLASMKTIFSTGSPLVEESFDYVYDHIKTNVQLASISGGTDIISCFVGGNPTLPVYRGELQCVGLGMDVAAYDFKGNALKNEKGELVCRKAFPSMPIYFWNDPDEQKYHKAYFDEFPGIWYHGDYIEVNEHGGVQIFGRSDATLNPGGVRIGTAEIYRVVDSFEEVADSLIVGQAINGDERVVLFMMLNEGQNLSDKFITEIKMAIRTHCSPRHVPAIILETEDIPYTINGKKVEIAVKKMIHGEDVANKDALANPESLELYRNLDALT
ncbi:MAG: acetoacetate--CoA ligase [Candidatus Marinimicrobia bacterium]|jgi:acetoacetyl-CoA synthetase|nr:acetoacetate--CoA ligase [Candidatus Neomarinimicrobiota bacterium]MDP6611128.1 acetoacetate--CoA ligase [Candidatus Neomarinimicrobiota bacterium]|tara:strand:- start:7306 stop:9252 length:1947 start_codon:yes stop_codon:yes gene_type:complete